MAKRSFTDTIKRQKRMMETEIAITVAETGAELQNQHKRVVRSWHHKPGFRVQRYNSPTVYSVKIVPTGRYARIWYYVDRGTKAHTIKAKNAPFLKFQTGYSARTAPVAKFNKGTGQRFGSWAQKTEVQHPGTEARKFTETFLKELQPPFPDRIQAAIQRGLIKANR